MKKVLLALTVAAVLVFAATASASSPSAYRAQVNGICAAGVKQLNAIHAPSKPSRYYAYFKAVAGASDKLLAKVAAVKPPSSLKAQVATAISLQGAFDTALHGLVSRLKTSSNPQATVNASAKKLNSMNAKANAAWRAVGAEYGLSRETVRKLFAERVHEPPSDLPALATELLAASRASS